MSSAKHREADKPPNPTVSQDGQVFLSREFLRRGPWPRITSSSSPTSLGPLHAGWVTDCHSGGRGCFSTDRPLQSLHCRAGSPCMCRVPLPLPASSDSCPSPAHPSLVQGSKVRSVQQFNVGSLPEEAPSHKFHPTRGCLQAQAC
jgi:hypothetical protein